MCVAAAELRLRGYAVLVPCRAAMHGRFPLNGTYFQINEVFLDNCSLSQPIQVLSFALSCHCASSRLKPSAPYTSIARSRHHQHVKRCSRGCSGYANAGA